MIPGRCVTVPAAAAAGLFATAVVCLAVARPAAALDGFEIQVYDGQANAPWDTSLEVHLNHTLDRHLPPQWEEQAQRGHITHATFEFALGIAPFWELGVYLQAAMPVQPTVEPAFGGAKLRSKFVLPHHLAGPWRLGANFEAAWIPERFDSGSWGGEVRPILGYKSSRWMAIVNPIIEVNFDAPSQSTLAPAVKVAHVLWHAWALGAEYYGGAAPTHAPGDLRLREQYVFVAADLWDRPLELNLAVGHGLTASAQTWVIKGIVGFPFG